MNLDVRLSNITGMIRGSKGSCGVGMFVSTRRLLLLSLTFTKLIRSHLGSISSSSFYSATSKDL